MSHTELQFCPLSSWCETWSQAKGVRDLSDEKDIWH